jgi:hypothetical protein
VPFLGQIVGSAMPFLIYVVIILIVVGLLMYLIDFIPMDATIKQIIRVVCIVAVVIWLLWMLVGYLPSGAFSPPRRP